MDRHRRQSIRCRPTRKYLGANVYNRSSFKLKHKRINNPMQMWIWRDGAFQPIVTASLFEQARTIVESRHSHLSDQKLLDRLRQSLRIQGRFSGILIDETDEMPSSSCYSSHNDRHLPGRRFPASRVRIPGLGKKTPKSVNLPIKAVSLPL